MELNAKQRAFAVEYMKDKNATQAAIRAGYSSKTAYSIGKQLLNKLEIQQKIKELQEEARARAGITVDMIVNRLNSIASNPEEKSSDRIRADELLGKYLGMFTEKVEMKGQLNTSVSKLDGILAQLKQ